MKSIRENIFNLFKSYGYTMKMYDADGQGPQLSPDSSTYIYATKGNTNYMIVIEDDDTSQYNSVALYRSDNTNKEEFRSILKKFRNIALKNAFSITIKNFGRGFTPKDFMDLPMKKKEEEAVSESFEISGMKKTSYHTTENAKVIVKHKKEVDEEKKFARSRNIQEIFVATKNGERRKVSETSLVVGKAVANHINHGGALFDSTTDLLITMGNCPRKLRKINLQESGDNLDSEKEQMISELAQAGKTMITKFLSTISKRKKPVDDHVVESFSSPEYQFTKAYFECLVKDEELAESLAIASILREIYA